MRGISWLADNRLASQEGLCSMEYLSILLATVLSYYRLKATFTSSSTGFGTIIFTDTLNSSVHNPMKCVLVFPYQTARSHAPYALWMCSDNKYRPLKTYWIARYPVVCSQGRLGPESFDRFSFNLVDQRHTKIVIMRFWMYKSRQFVSSQKALFSNLLFSVVLAFDFNFPFTQIVPKLRSRY